MCSKDSKYKGLRRTIVYNITHRLAQQVLPNRYAKLDGDIRPYLAALMDAKLVWAEEALVALKSTYITMIIREAFDNILLHKARCKFNTNSLVSKQVQSLGVEGMHEEVNQMHYKHLEAWLGKVFLAMTSLIERLADQGMGQVIEYEKELMQNMLILA